jgi:hypothetical protein
MTRTPVIDRFSTFTIIDACLYWSTEFGVEPEQLRSAVKATGNRAESSEITSSSISSCRSRILPLLSMAPLDL